MAVIAYVVLPGVTKERHDQIRAEAGWLAGRASGARGVRPAAIVMYFNPASMNAGFDKFGVTLAPILQQIGLDPGQPMVKPSHNP
jgi:hypothetical protein